MHAGEVASEPLLRARQKILLTDRLFNSRGGAATTNESTGVGLYVQGILLPNEKTSEL
jgi:hypothetical protein